MNNSKESMGFSDPNKIDYKRLYLMYCTFAVAFLYLAGGLATLGTALWILFAEKIWSSMVEIPYITQGGIILAVCGGTLVFAGALGMYGSMKENNFLLSTYLFLLFCNMVMLVAVGIMGAVTEQRYPNQLRDKMSSLLKDYYGVNLGSVYNHDVTNSWDKLQDEEECCGVEDNSYSLYRSSAWHQEQEGIPESTKPYVPQTCCVKDHQGNYLDKSKCQLWKGGPPGIVSSNVNKALIYRGCHSIVREYLKVKAIYMTGFGFGIAVCLIPGFILTIVFMRRVSKSS